MSRETGWTARSAWLKRLPTGRGAAVERALSEYSLQKSEEKFRTVLDNAYEGISMFDLVQGRMTYGSPSMLKMTGFAEPAFLNLALDEYLANIHSDDVDEQRQSFRLLASGQDMPQEAEYRWCVSGGGCRWFRDRRSIIRDERGQATGLVIISRDVTDQKDSENRIAFQSHLLENVHDAIIATDENFKLTYWNETAEKLFGWTAVEALGHTTQELLQPILAEPTRESAINRLLQNDFYSGEVTYHHKNGAEIQVDNRARAIRDKRGKICETVTSIRDIRERRQAEAALQESRKHALDLVAQMQESDRNKNHFISVLSHELRNPLAAIVMGLALLEHSMVHEEQKQRALIILKRQSEHLTSLVDDLLDVTRINENKIKLKKMRIELIALIRQLVSDYQASYDTKGVALDVSLFVREIYLEADPVRLNQVIGNLLHNALKFTQPGGLGPDHRAGGGDRRRPWTSHRQRPWTGHRRRPWTGAPAAVLDPATGSGRSGRHPYRGYRPGDGGGIAPAPVHAFHPG